MFRRQHHDQRQDGQRSRARDRRLSLALRQPRLVSSKPLSPLLPPALLRPQLPTRPIRCAAGTQARAIERRSATVGGTANANANAKTNADADTGTGINISIDWLDQRSASRNRKRFVLVSCLVLLALGGILGIHEGPGTATAQGAPTPTPTPFTPPRGVANDLWADAVIGKPDFNTIAPNQTTNNSLFWVNGALVITNTNGSGSKLFVYDAGNNRILGIDAASCMATPGPNCHADFVIGQPNMSTAGCNHDSGFQGFPVRASAGADTLCLQPESSMSLSETGSGASMAVDSQGRLFVADYFNNRVLRYPNLFPTPTGTPAPIRADRVIGQADYTSTLCNRSQAFALGDVDSHGDIVGEAPSIPLPDSNTLCFDWGDQSGGVVGNNWVAGVDLDAQGNLWVADSGNNRVLRFNYDRATDTFSSTASVVLGQPDFQHRDPGLDAYHLTNPSVVRVNKQTEEVYVADQGYSGSNGNMRVLVFEPPFNSPPTPNEGRVLNYFQHPWGLDFDADRPDNLWVNAYDADHDQLQAWHLPSPTSTPPATPTLVQVLGGDQSTLSKSSGSIGIDNQTSAYPTPLNQLEVLFATDQGGAYPNDVVAFGLPHPPTPLPGLTSTPTPIKSLFGTPGPGGNKLTNSALGEGDGVAVSDNPTRPQLFASDNGRILFWDNPTTSQGEISLANGQEGTPLATPTNAIATPTATPLIQHLKATHNYLYVSANCCGANATQAWIDIYHLPVDATSTPVASYYYPGGFVTVDYHSLQHYSNYSTRSASLFIAPTSDDQYLWVGATEDNRVFRLRNPISQSSALVDVMLGQQDLYNYGCNTHQVTPWASPTNVTAYGNTITKTGGIDGQWDAGARSAATIGQPDEGSWDTLKGYAQITVDATATTRAFGLAYDHTPTPTPTGTPAPSHDFHDIDFAYVLSGQNTLQIYERGNPNPVYTGSYAQNDILRVALEASASNPGYSYRIVYYQNEVVRRSTDVGGITFPMYLEASIASSGGSVSDAYLAASEHLNMTDDSLCLPSSATVDRQGNLWVSDDALEQQGNMRLLEYDANIFPSNPTTMTYALPATRIFPRLATWEPAFDLGNNLFVGYNHYTNTNGFTDNPPAPTPLPGTPATGLDFSGRFPGVYINPLYPLPSYTSTPVPTGSPTPSPTATRPAPSPNALLADLYSNAYAATFDDYDNLYVRDLNRSRVLVYRRPEPGAPVTWVTPLVNATITPTNNSVQKTSGTDEVWDAGAVSSQAIKSGNGYVMISVETPATTSTNTPTATPSGTYTPQPDGLNARRAFGLSGSSRNHAHRLQDLDFAFVLTGTNSLDIYERGVFVAHEGTYDHNDLLEVAVEDGPGSQGKVVRYYHNWAAVYTDTNPSLEYPLQFDTSIATMGGRIANATIYAADSFVTCSASGWCADTIQTQGVPDGLAVLNGLAVLSPNNIWAVGTFEQYQPTSLVEYWNGTQWQRFEISGRDNAGPLHGVSAATDGTYWYMWAAGDTGVLFYDGRSNTWSLVPGPTGGNGVYARTTSDVWTVGSGSSSQGIWHLANGSWSQIPISAGVTLNGVTATGPNDAWAVGVQYMGDPPGGGQVVTMHWNGSNWSTVTAPSPGGMASLAGVDAYDANHVWAVGSYVNANGHQSDLTEYWNGTQWTQVTAPDPPSPGTDSELESVHFTKEGSVWAVGDYSYLTDPNNPSSPRIQKTVILWWNGTAWSMEDNPNPGATGASTTFVDLGSAAGSSPVITDTWVLGHYLAYQGASVQTLLETLKAPAPPLTTTTYYMTTVSGSTSYSLGCSAGTNRESGIIVLDYGQPRLWNPGPPSQYGTLLIGSQSAAYIIDPGGNHKDITTSVEKFINGYKACQSQQQPPLHASIAIGTNNNNLDGNASLTTGHAQAWAGLVSAVQAYVINNSFDGYVDVQGAIDLEPDWSSYSLAHDWASAYSGQAVSYLYNYGSTDGYPAVPPGQPTPVVPPPWGYSLWDSHQLYDLSGGVDSSGGIAGILAVPQIFQLTLSKDWHAVSLWGVANGLPALQFAGAASASTLCPSITQNAGTGVCYYPQQAWQVFFHELSADPLVGNPQLWGISQLADRSTDIKCSNGSTNQSCK